MKKTSAHLHPHWPHLEAALRSPLLWPLSGLALRSHAVPVHLLSRGCLFTLNSNAIHICPHLNSENVSRREVRVPYRLQNLGHFCRLICCHLQRTHLATFQQLPHLDKLDSLVALLVDVENLC